MDQRSVQIVPMELYSLLVRTHVGKLSWGKLPSSFSTLSSGSAALRHATAPDSANSRSCWAAHNMVSVVSGHVRWTNWYRSGAQMPWIRVGRKGHVKRVLRDHRACTHFAYSTQRCQLCLSQQHYRSLATHGTPLHADVAVAFDNVDL
jgi:hypothetical protein